jgi:hypothetical protein
MKRKSFIKIVFFLSFLIVGIGNSFGQEKDTVKYLQLTGIVVNDSLQRLPFTAVYDKTTQRGVIADYFGYFAMVVHPGDTIQFSFIGFKKKSFIVPTPADSSLNISIVSLLESDTLMSDPVEVYPWPSREQFADAFVNLEIDTDAVDRARSRLSPQEMAFVYGTVGSDASLSYKSQTNQYLNQVYYRGQQAPNNLLNPVAWNNFLKSLNNGDLKITR